MDGSPPPLSHPASMSVKEILQSLVDDALVDAERIGTSNYFWAFPSKAANNVRPFELLILDLLSSVVMGEPLECRSGCRVKVSVMLFSA